MAKEHKQPEAEDLPAPAVDKKGGNEAALRAIKAIKLRTAGYTYEQIAESLGYADRSSAYNAVKFYIKKTGGETVETLRHFEEERLKQIFIDVLRTRDAEQYEDYKDPATGEIKKRISPKSAYIRLEANALLIRLSERRSRLHGLDAPVNIRLDTDNKFSINLLGPQDVSLLPEDDEVASTIQDDDDENELPEI